MKIVHIVSDRNETNGMYRVAVELAQEQCQRGDASRVVTCAEFLGAECADCDEVVVHGCWLPCYWRCCLKVLRSKGNRPRLVRMTHGSLSPIYLAQQSKWKKRLVGSIERWLLRRSDRVVATCEAECGWIAAYLGGRGDEAKIRITDLKRFFKLDAPIVRPRMRRRMEVLHVLYLGRRHPLKGVQYLERAVSELNYWAMTNLPRCPRGGAVELRVVSDHRGEELERDWEWCDVLCLPTLSENFGRVVAEALEHGRCVITTDGAPAWGDFKSCRNGERADGFVYLRGFREGTEEKRVALLKDALKRFVD